MSESRIINKMNSTSIKDFLDLSGKNRNLNILKTHLLQIKATEKETDLIINYFNLLVNSSYFSESTYLYLVKGMSYKKIASILNKKSESYLGNITHRECKGLFDKLGNDPYIIVFKKYYIRQDIKVSNYINSLNSIILGLLETTYTRGVKSLEGDKLKQLGKYPVSMYNNYNKDKMVSYIRKLRVLSDNYLDFMLNTMDEDYINHIYYVIDTPNTYLSKEDIDLKNIIRRLWMVDED